MASRGAPEIADWPLGTFVTTTVLAFAVYAGLQLTLGGQVDLVRSVTFAVVFAAALVGFSWLRRRLTG